MEIFDNLENDWWVKEDIFDANTDDSEINKYFETCEKQLDKRFFFHTSNPQRYNFLDTREIEKLETDKNLWFGQDLETLEKFYEVFWIPNHFLNIKLTKEPKISDKMLWCVKWVILDISYTDETNWVDSIIDCCKKNYVPIYVLGDNSFPKQFPRELQK
jgi:protein gp37